MSTIANISNFEGLRKFKIAYKSPFCLKSYISRKVFFRFRKRYSDQDKILRNLTFNHGHSILFISTQIDTL